MDAAMMETSLSIPIPPAVAKHARQAQCFMGDVGTDGLRGCVPSWTSLAKILVAAERTRTMTKTGTRTQILDLQNLELKFSKLFSCRRVVDIRYRSVHS